MPFCIALMIQNNIVCVCYINYIDIIPTLKSIFIQIFSTYFYKISLLYSSQTTFPSSQQSTQITGHISRTNYFSEGTRDIFIFLSRVFKNRCFIESIVFTISREAPRKEISDTQLLGPWKIHARKNSLPKSGSRENGKESGLYLFYITRCLSLRYY